MRVIITAVGFDHWGLADPIMCYVTSVGARIAEIQMYDHDDGGLFTLLLRLKWPGTRNTLADLRAKMAAIGRENAVSIRVWSRDEYERPPRLAVCVTYRREPALAVLEGVRAGRLRATPVVLIGNRPACRAVAEEFGIDWHMVGDAQGKPDNDRMAQLVDQYEVDYIVLARYMRLIPPSTCWKFGGGRIINLHHGLLPAFPGADPYRDACAQHMLTYGATVHFIVPELDAGGQIIHQESFTVAPGTPLTEIVRIGQGEHEPRCLVEGLRRVLDREVELRFDKVVAVQQLSERRRRAEGHLNTDNARVAQQAVASPTPSVIQRDGQDATCCVSETPLKASQPGKGNVLLISRSAVERRHPKLPPVIARSGEWQRVLPTGSGRDIPSPFRCRRFHPVTIGFWLGGVCLGTGGCILGAFMPYRHPVAVALSVLWWGIYFGCFGAGIGALVGQVSFRVPCDARPGLARLLVAYLVIVLAGLAALAAVMKAWQRGAQDPGPGDPTGRERTCSAESLKLRRDDIPRRLLALAGSGNPVHAPPELATVLGDGRFRRRLGAGSCRPREARGCAGWTVLRRKRGRAEVISARFPAALDPVPLRNMARCLLRFRPRTHVRCARGRRGSRGCCADKGTSRLYSGLNRDLSILYRAIFSETLRRDMPAILAVRPTCPLVFRSA
jgi:formyltetrahydrofolate deformylase